ncbi:Ribosomal 50S subunit-recycling heat shock protein, contains S4 domain [Gracilibacillus ureilyticus]|uniref:RQC P-site tRNA stabilizing factor n=1 Tax=Gracilibacillus ureilyticus TaxID=531814 RepID=A0A1H9VM65_9BACI|nr:RNA-binding S4 domain-containing protein [Gracilibacillus ureilyticus]SES22785.1 Ribosomal 50S subunit-recycling heat shock protein, contains S4 domain [Gracilibacillus ureilyticus]
MRLDKFLKVSRLIKRRTLAKEIADQGRIIVNGNTAKAATNVAVGDELKIQFGQRLLTIQIDQLKETVRKEEASDLYTIKSEEYKEN